MTEKMPYEMKTTVNSWSNKHESHVNCKNSRRT